MRKAAVLLALLACAGPADAYQYWNDIRHSAPLPGGAVLIRAENPSGPGTANALLHANGGVVEEPMAPVADGPSTVAAQAPAPASSRRYYGFRLLQGAEIDFLPVRVADGANPASQDLTRLSLDAVGDHLFGYVNLDLVECRVSFSGTRLYAALKNAGGGFPVSQGLTFFGYLLAIADPAIADPDTVYALMQTYNQPGVISPGLYRITGPDLGDLTKIGNVTVQEYPASNTLMLSCNLSDLTADPYFASWFDPSDRAVGVAGFTQRITLLSGAAESDRTPGGRCYLREVFIDPVVNHAPSLSALTVAGTGASAYASLDYADLDAHCPAIGEVSFDGGAPYPMYPQSLDYGSAVEYRTAAGIAPLAGGAWGRAVASFSDDLVSFVESEAVRAGAGSPLPHALTASIHPNPFESTTRIAMELPRPERVRVDIFDAQGALVRALYSGDAAAGRLELAWDGRHGRGSPAPGGVYFCRISASRSVLTEKVLLER